MWPFDGIYDSWKTTELFITGTVPAGAEVLFIVQSDALQFNEVDAPAIFARVTITADERAAGLLLSPFGVSRLPEIHRRHNIVRRVCFSLRNTIGADINLTPLANIANPAGQPLPPGLMVMLAGEPAAPLFNVGQVHLAHPALVIMQNGFDVRDRANTGLVFRAAEISPAV